MKRINVKCPKCDGRGSLSHYSHYAAGRCFTCGGAGTVRADDPGAEEILNFKANDAARVISFYWTADPQGDVAKSRRLMVVKALFEVGTDRARRVLDRLASGRLMDDDGTLIPAAWGAEERARIVALGREMAAEQA